MDQKGEGKHSGGFGYFSNKSFPTVLDSAFELHEELPLYTSPYDMPTSLQRYACYYNDTTERSPMDRRPPRPSLRYYVPPSNLLTHSMEQNSSWEANRFSACQEIPRILWNPKVH
jgi:hypothetical protein